MNKDRVTNSLFHFSLVFTMLIIVLFIYSAIQPKPYKSQGYGGSPGHLSPMEVEELGNRTRKP